MEILQLAPQSPSDFYWIRASEHAVKQMYCDMERSCKGVGGGWMRVASINMTDTSHQCPSGLRNFSRSSPPHSLCAMNIDNAGCCTMYVLVPTHVTLNMLQFLHLWDMATSVIQPVKITTSTSSIQMILCGMGKDVVSTTHAAPGTLLHGS